MRCVLRIGYESFLLPDHKGVDKIIDMLSKGVKCRTWYGHGDEIELDGTIELGMSLVPEKVKLKATKSYEEEMEGAPQGESKPRAKQKALSGRNVLQIDFKK